MDYQHLKFPQLMLIGEVIYVNDKELTYPR